MMVMVALVKKQKYGIYKNWFFFKRILILKNYYRRILNGVKKGISTPTLPPKTLNLLSHPLIRVFRMLGGICMFMCVTNRIYAFNNFLKYLIVTIFILNLLFTVYITIVRDINIKKLITEGEFDVRNSR